jgi:RNA polymerase sigma-70 factor (ECF subfamily)
VRAGNGGQLGAVYLRTARQARDRVPALTQYAPYGKTRFVPGPDPKPMIAAATSLPMDPTQAVATTDTVPAQWTRDEFQRQVRPHLPRLHRMCLAMCRDASQAEDLLQNTLVKAYLGRHGFVGRGSFVGWLFGIVRHEHEELVRTAARRRSLMNRAIERCALVVEDLFATPPPSPEAWVGVEEEGAILLECLQSVPEPYRIVVWLCDVEELSHEEIATTLGIASGTVKSRHSRGRTHLRAAYERRLNRTLPGGTP